MPQIDEYALLCLSKEAKEYWENKYGNFLKKYISVIIQSIFSSKTKEYALVISWDNKKKAYWASLFFENTICVKVEKIGEHYLIKQHNILIGFSRSFKGTINFLLKEYLKN
jgi:hypothetical protein